MLESCVYAWLLTPSFKVLVVIAGGRIDLITLL